MRKTLSLCLYMLLVELVAIYLVVVPVYAFQVSSSTTGYVRIVNAQTGTALVAASRPAQLSAVAAAASAGGTSLALRLVTGFGWAGIGVAAGMILYQAYYSSEDLAAVKTAAQGVGAFQVPSAPGVHIQSYQSCPGATGCSVGSDQYVTVFVADFCTNSVSSLLLGEGWIFAGSSASGPCPGANTHWNHSSGVPSTKGAEVPGPIPTAADINAWLDNRPPSDPLSLPAHTAPAGVGSSAQPADDVILQSVPATAGATQVISATSVGPTDVVVNKDATAPAGPVPTQNATQTTTATSTTTTTTITNPDGSTTSTSTSTETEEAPVSSCSTGNHEPRTFGGILQDHMDLWKGSGLLSALTLLKTLTWPTAIPTYSLQSNLLGTFTLDFSAWSGMLTAIRSIIIAIAGFVACKIVFVGAR